MVGPEDRRRRHRPMGQGQYAGRSRMDHPPEFETFRLIAERPVVVDFTSIPLQELAMREWRRRIRDVYGDVPGGGFVAQHAMDANYRAMTREKAAQLSAEYRARFAVLDRETPWPGKPLYENGTYKAVSLETPH
ncbi:DUF6798 domain-containing protein [Sphingomonas daechungensis]|uniref:DUF6798 domain-containing protein n=1 Tax=Sphingomonas daechungensis TaxID=1176646 RepID=UPI0037DA6135